MSLSSILGDIGLSAGGGSSGAAGGETAACILLREKQRVYREILSSDFVPFEVGGKEHTNTQNAMFSQISASSVDTPKYWTTKNASASTLTEGSMLMSSKKQKDGRGNKGSKATKAHRDHKKKGELYADRMQAKLTSKSKLAPPKSGKKKK